MTDKAQRIALWTLAFLLVVGTGLALRYARGYRPLAGLPEPASGLPGDIGIRLDGVRAVGRDKGKPAWTLTAGRIETTRARSRIDFSGGIQATLREDGASAATLTAPSATYDQYARLLTLAGSIVCTVQDLTVTAAALRWTSGSSIVQCPGSVTATHPRGDVRGEELSVDLRTRDFSLRNFTARYRIDASQDLP